MAIFENLFNNQEKQQLQAENRAMDFQREQTIVGTNISGNNSDATDLFMQNQRSDLIRWQQECDEELLELVNQLMGLRMNKEGQLVQATTSLCNSLFIDKVVIPNCKPFMSKNIINTNYSEMNILNTLKSTMRTVVTNMKNNYKEYNIEFSQYDNVWRIILNHIKPNVYRAIDGWTKKEDSRVIKRIESLNDNNNQQNNRGFFGIPKNN